MRMKNIFKKLMLLGLVSLGSNAAFAGPLDQRFCSQQPVPSGWVVNGYFPRNESCIYGGYTARYIQHLPVGSVVRDVCGGTPVPPGWRQVGDASFSSACHIPFYNQGWSLRIDRVQ